MSYDTIPVITPEKIADNIPHAFIGILIVAAFGYAIWVIRTVGKK